MKSYLDYLENSSLYFGKLAVFQNSKMEPAQKFVNVIVDSILCENKPRTDIGVTHGNTICTQKRAEMGQDECWVLEFSS